VHLFEMIKRIKAKKYCSSVYVMLYLYMYVHV